MKKNDEPQLGAEMNRSLRTPLPVPFFYGWVVVVLSFSTTLVGAGIRSAATVLIHPLEMEFGWSRAAIASAILRTDLPCGDINCAQKFFKKITMS